MLCFQESWLHTHKSPEAHTHDSPLRHTITNRNITFISIRVYLSGKGGNTQTGTRSVQRVKRGLTTARLSRLCACFSQFRAFLRVSSSLLKSKVIKTTPPTQSANHSGPTLGRSYERNAAASPWAEHRAQSMFSVCAQPVPWHVWTRPWHRPVAHVTGIPTNRSSLKQNYTVLQRFNESTVWDDRRCDLGTIKGAFGHVFSLCLLWTKGSIDVLILTFIFLNSYLIDPNHNYDSVIHSYLSSQWTVFYPVDWHTFFSLLLSKIVVFY